MGWSGQRRLMSTTLLALAVNVRGICPPDFLDTGQNGGSLSVNGSVDGSPVDLKGHGVLVLPYCDQASPVCTLGCRVTFETRYTPRYYIKEGCFPAGGNTSVKELEKIGVNATYAHPNYVVQFLCHAIPNYTCYMNETVYTQVEVRPATDITTLPSSNDTTACATPTPPSTSTPPAISNGNATNGTTTNGPPTADNGFSAGEIAGTVVGGLVIVAVITVFFILLYYAWVHRDALRSQVNAAIGMMRSCAHPHNEPPTDAKLGTADDNGGAEMVFGLTDNVSGSGWLQRVIAITRGPRKDPLCD